MHVLKHQVNDSLFAEGFFEFDYVRVFEHFEYFDFAHSSLFDDLVFLRLFEFFNSHDFFILVAAAF